MEQCKSLVRRSKILIKFSGFLNHCSFGMFTEIVCPEVLFRFSSEDSFVVYVNVLLFGLKSNRVVQLRHVPTSILYTSSIIRPYYTQSLHILDGWTHNKFLIRLEHLCIVVCLSIHQMLVAINSEKNAYLPQSNIAGLFNIT